MTPIFYVIFAVLTIYNVRKTKKTVAMAIQRCVPIIQPQKRQLTLNAQLLRMLLVQVKNYSKDKYTEYFLFYRLYHSLY
jgi:hypothetical protein